MKNGRRDYEAEKNWEKKKKPSRLRDRVKRVQARREMEKVSGDMPSSMHVDHKTPLKSGGTNSKGNLRWITAKHNLKKEANSRKK
jgi:hypothetical protein